MKYDFSKIETEKLRVACEYFEAHGTMSCMGIDCYVCPLKEKACGCVRKPYAAINKEEKYKLFKEELIRREKMENKMPTIVSGMVVEFIVSGNVSIDRFLYVDDICYDLDGGHWVRFSDHDRDILKIYKVKPCSFTKINEKLELIWSKKSDKDIKIEELERTIKKAQEQIQELKG